MPIVYIVYGLKGNGSDFSLALLPVSGVGFSFLVVHTSMSSEIPLTTQKSSKTFKFAFYL